MKRVVITGLGILAPIGNTLEKVWDSLLSLKSGIQYMKEWENIEGLKSKVAGLVGEYSEKDIPRKFRRTMGPMAVLGALAAQRCLENSGLEVAEIQSEKTALIFGSTTGSGPCLENFFRTYFEKGFREQEGTLFMKVMSHSVAVNVAAYLGIQGMTYSPNAACATSTQSIGLGYELIRHGLQEIAICGGAEDLHPSTAGVFDILQAASRNYLHSPQKTPRPFDQHRDGLVVSEGASAVVLEEYERAKRRGAKIYGEIIGYATNREGSHMTFPSQKGMKRCMELAIESAGISPCDLDYINCHATGTLIGDQAEASALRELFSDKVPISATKGFTGHTLAACGAMELIFCLLMMENSLIIPTRNLEEIDPACEGLFHVQKPMTKKINFCMTNNFAFGGINASLIISNLREKEIPKR